MFDDPHFWVGVAFLGFIAVLVYTRVPRTIAKSLDARADTIRRELDDARRLREEAKQLLADYQRKTREAGNEAEAIVAQSCREAEVLSQETHANLKETLERRTKLVEERIARAEAQAVSEVRAAAVDTAIAAAERILRAKLTGDVAAQLVDQGIKELRGKLN